MITEVEQEQGDSKIAVASTTVEGVLKPKLSEVIAGIYSRIKAIESDTSASTNIQGIWEALDGYKISTVNNVSATYGSALERFNTTDAHVAANALAISGHTETLAAITNSKGNNYESLTDRLNAIDKG